LSDQDKILVGRIVGLYGLRGWVKVYSYTQPLDNIVEYNPWRLRLGDDWRRFHLRTGKRHGKTVIARLQGIDDREQAGSLIGADIAISPSQLRTLPEDEFYWAQLIGLRVFNLIGEPLGVVDHVLETGANDVLVLSGTSELLIPFVQGEIIKSVCLDKGYIVADWDMTWQV
jgi:16S rRNA processing protein RimM